MKVRVKQSAVHVPVPLSAGSVQLDLVSDANFHVPMRDGVGSSLLQANAARSTKIYALSSNVNFFM